MSGGKGREGELAITLFLKGALLLTSQSAVANVSLNCSSSFGVLNCRLQVHTRFPCVYVQTNDRSS